MEAYGNDAYESANGFSNCELWLPEDPKECSNLSKGSTGIAIFGTVAIPF